MRARDRLLVGLALVTMTTACSMVAGSPATDTGAAGAPAATVVVGQGARLCEGESVEATVLVDRCEQLDGWIEIIDPEVRQTTDRAQSLDTILAACANLISVEPVPTPGLDSNDLRRIEGELCAPPLPPVPGPGA